MATVEKIPPRRLARSRTNRVWLGVCGGLGDYFGVDPAIIRVLWVIITIFTGLIPGLLAYLICGIVMPQQ